MRRAGLDERMIELMHKHCDRYWGCCAIQEQMMEILMDVAHFTLGEANGARKIVGKKLMDKIPDLKKSVYEKMGETKPANIKGIIQGIDDRGHTLCEGPGWSEWRTIIDKAFKDYVSLTPTKPREQILTETQNDVQTVLDEANAKKVQ